MVTKTRRKRTKKKELSEIEQAANKAIEARSVAEASFVETDTIPEKKTTPEIPKVTKSYTKRTVILVLSGIGILFGVGGFILMVAANAVLIGAPAILIGVPSAIAFKIYWDKTETSLQVEHIGDVPKKQVNCLSIYRDRVVFEDWHNPDTKPGGYIQECQNDHKKYWVNISDLEYSNPGGKAALAPFQLSDQQFFDPTVFAERVLSLPAHRELFKQKEKWPQIIKTGLLVLTVAIIWILILTTTGG